MTAPKPSRAAVLRALASPVEHSRYEMRPINNGASSSVFDRKTDAFLAIGEIPNIDPTETWTGGGE